MQWSSSRGCPTASRSRSGRLPSRRSNRLAGSSGSAAPRRPSRAATMRSARLRARPRAASMRRPVRSPRYWRRRCWPVRRCLHSTSRRHRRILRRRIPRFRQLPANKETASSIHPPDFLMRFLVVKIGICLCCVELESLAVWVLGRPPFSGRGWAF